MLTAPIPLLGSGSSPTDWPVTLNANLVARYDFSTSDDLTLSGSEITGASDLGPNGYDLSPPTATERPAFATGILNGLGGADFSNDTNSELASSVINTTGSFTYGLVLSGGTDLLGAFDGSIVTPNGFRFYNNNQIDFMAGVLTAVSFTGSASGTNIIATVEDQGGFVSCVAYKSGVSSAVAANSTAVDPLLYGIALGTINGGGAGDYQDYIHEVAVWDTVLTSDLRGDWDDYILAKWGI